MIKRISHRLGLDRIFIQLNECFQFPHQGSGIEITQLVRYKSYPTPTFMHSLNIIKFWIWSSEDNASLLEGSTDNIGIGIVLCRIYLHVNNTSLFLELSSLSIQCMSISNMFIWFSFKFICDTVKKHDVIHIEETLWKQWRIYLK